MFCPAAKLISISEFLVDEDYVQLIEEAGPLLYYRRDRTDALCMVAVHAFAGDGAGRVETERCAFFEHATALTRAMPLSRLAASLFLPTTSTTFFGPPNIAATRLPLPSIFMSLAFIVMALVEHRYQSAALAFSKISRALLRLDVPVEIDGVALRAQSVGKPSELIVIEPPQPTEARSPISSNTSFFASSPPAAL